MWLLVDLLFVMVTLLSSDKFFLLLNYADKRAVSFTDGYLLCIHLSIQCVNVSSSFDDIEKYDGAGVNGKRKRKSRCFSGNNKKENIIFFSGVLQKNSRKNILNIFSAVHICTIAEK